MTKAEALERAKLLLEDTHDYAHGETVERVALALREAKVERWVEYKKRRAKARAELMGRIGCKFCGKPCVSVYMLTDGMWARLGMAPRENAHLACIDLRAAKMGIDLAEFKYKTGAPIELEHFTEASCNDNIRWAFIEGRASE